MLSGRIVKGIGGFYYVDTESGVIECRARGLFRKEGTTPLVGDEVEISLDEASGCGYVEKIMPRRNELTRPPVANVTQMAAVAALTNPRFNAYAFDKLIASAEYAGIEPIVCLNKSDLTDDEEFVNVYRGAGFKTILLSAQTGGGIDELASSLRGNVTVFAGNSGVGKSSLLNMIMQSDIFETGEISQKAERGRHTTRHSELAALKGGGYIIDTPGFGSLDMSSLEAVEIAGLFREFEPYISECRFRDCSHTVENGCAVLDAINRGEIARSRHESYVKLYDELKEINRWK